MSLLFSGRHRERSETAAAPVSCDREMPRWLQEIVVYGCHGGAGTSTLATLLGIAWDIGSYRQVRTEIDTYGRPLVVTCRDNVNGSARAVAALRFLVENGVRPAALVVVSEGSGPEPDEAAMRFRLAETTVRGVVRFPFVAGLRYVASDQAREVELPKRAQAALSEIKRLCLMDARAALAER